MSTISTKDGKPAAAREGLEGLGLIELFPKDFVVSSLDQHPSTTRLGIDQEGVGCHQAADEDLIGRFGVGLCVFGIDFHFLPFGFASIALNQLINFAFDLIQIEGVLSDIGVLNHLETGVVHLGCNRRRIVGIDVH